MPENAVPALKFFVYIIESPSALDLYRGRSEGGRVAETLRLDDIPCVTRTAINSIAFKAALRYGLPETIQQYPEHHPILHLSAHGSYQGIQLSSNEIITWTELRDLLIPVNKSLGGQLFLCMSACQGYSACQMAMVEGDVPHPYLFMVGSSESPTWSDTAVSYLSFYHLLSKGCGITDAVASMSAASGVKWICETANTSKQFYLDFLRKPVESEVVQRELESSGALSSLPAEAKGLENS